MSVFVQIYIYVLKYTRFILYLYIICMYMNIYIRMYHKCVYKHIRIVIHIFIYIYKCTYIHIYTSIQHLEAGNSSQYFEEVYIKIEI
jgi:hypothetical protein